MNSNISILSHGGLGEHGGKPESRKNMRELIAGPALK
jgi:hypothetical protein